MKPLKKTIDNKTIYKIGRDHIKKEYVDKLMFTPEMYRIYIRIKKCSQNDYSVSK